MEALEDLIAGLDTATRARVEPLLDIAKEAIKDTNSTCRFKFPDKLIKEFVLRFDANSIDQTDFLNSPLSPAIGLKKKRMKELINTENTQPSEEN